MLETIKNMVGIDSKQDDEKSLVAMVEKKAKDAEDWLEPFHRQWFINIAMRRGAQYVMSHGKGIQIAPEADDPNRVRIIANKLQGIHSTRLAKIVKDLPKLECIPSSGEEKDKDLARRGTKLMDYVWQKERIPEKLVEALSWSIDTGNVFLMPRWDPTKGPEIPIHKRHEGQITGQEGYQVDAQGYVLNDAGERIVETITVGDVVIDIIKPFDFVNDGTSIDVQDQDYFLIQQAMTLKKVKATWPQRGKNVKADSDGTKTRAMYQKRLQALATNQGDSFAEAKNNKDLVTVRFYFEKKCEEYPQGRMLVCANGVLLESKPLPIDGGEEYNVIHIGDVHISGCFWKMGTIENVLPVQKGYNRTLSQIIENANNMGNIKMLAPKGSKLSSEAFDDSGSEVIEYEVTNGGEPHEMTPAALPSYVVNLLEIYDKNFEDGTGQHEVSHGKAPAGVKSGAALNALQEQDDTRLAPTKIMLLRSLERMGVMILKLYEQNMKIERKFQIIGETNFDVEELMLKPEEVRSINKDVRTQTENLIASHKRLQQEQVMELYQAGVLGNPDDPRVRKKVLQILEFGNVADIFDELNVDTSQARKENDQLAIGEGLIPMPNHEMVDPQTGQPVLIPTLQAFYFENHEVHLEIHNSFRKSPRYRQMTPLQRQGVDHHAKQHENFLNPKPAPINAGPSPMTPPNGGAPLSPPRPMVPPKVNMPPVVPPSQAGAIPPSPAMTPDIEGTDLMTGEGAP